MENNNSSEKSLRDRLREGVKVDEEKAVITAQGQTIDEYTLSRIAGRSGRGERP